uniref:Ankyrin repeat protein n=1 Tax=viral metagenome TaxID=1070528 RepID=A0A6C0EEZ6_9ZZZZ
MSLSREGGASAGSPDNFGGGCFGDGGFGFGSAEPNVDSNVSSIEEQHNMTIKEDIYDKNAYVYLSIKDELFMKILDKILNINIKERNYNSIIINGMNLYEFICEKLSIKHLKIFMEIDKFKPSFYEKLFRLSCKQGITDFIKILLENDQMENINFNSKNENGKTGYDLVRDNRCFNRDIIIKLLENDPRIDTPEKLLKKEISELKEQFSKSKEENSRFKKEIITLKKENTSLKRKVDNDKKQITKSNKKCKV